MVGRKRPTDWYQRFQSAKEPHVVTLQSDFAGVNAGMQMLISSPGEIASFVARIPQGEVRTIARLRSDLSRRANADAMCPVTTSIFLKVVAEVSLADLASGKQMSEVVPFWRIVEPTSKLASKISCGRDGIEHLLRLDGYTISDNG